MVHHTHHNHHVTAPDAASDDESTDDDTHADLVRDSYHYEFDDDAYGFYVRGHQVHILQHHDGSEEVLGTDDYRIKLADDTQDDNVFDDPTSGAHIHHHGRQHGGDLG